MFRRIVMLLVTSFLFLPTVSAEAQRAAPSPTTTAQATPSQGGLRRILRNARRARCATAICWGTNNEFALEPLGELPIGKVFSFNNGGLGNFINNHDISVSIAAGLRLWIAHDMISFSFYFSKQLEIGDETIRLAGSEYEHRASRVRRPFPGIGVGLLGDIIWLGFDVNQLRNGDNDMDRDFAYRRDQVVARAWSISISIAPIALARNGIGSATTR